MPTISHLSQVLSAYRPTLREDAGRYAAVAAVLRDTEAGAEVLLIRRTESPTDPWSGQMAMPGGKQDAADLTLHHTAVRETFEEVGVDLRTAVTLGRLDDTQAMARGRRTDLVIAPFVFAVTGAVSASPSAEVQEAVWVPLRVLAAPETYGTYAYELPGGTQVQLPCWRWQGYIIWGLTHHMLRHLLIVAGLVR